MNDKYLYQGPPEQQIFGVLAAGDYEFRVLDCGIPYMRNDKWVLPLKLSIEPSGAVVFANPWQGTTRDGKPRDSIAEFLLAVNQAPEKGQEPKWNKVIGSRGRCRLKVEVAQQGALAGKEVNKVAFFLRPHQLEPTQATRSPSVSPKADIGIGGEEEADEIPFASW